MKRKSGNRNYDGGKCTPGFDPLKRFLFCMAINVFLFLLNILMDNKISRNDIYAMLLATCVFSLLPKIILNIRDSIKS